MTHATVTLGTLPASSPLHALIDDQDFLDCYTVPAQTTPREAARIITSFPGWVKALLALRGIVTAPFGLKQDGPEDVDKIGPFPVESETPDEVIAGFDDRHLNFRVSVIARAGQVSLATWVHPHNIGGRMYLALIMPFHIAIARNALARVAAACPASAQATCMTNAASLVLRFLSTSTRWKPPV